MSYILLKIKFLPASANFFSIGNKISPGNTSLRGRLTTVSLLILVTCFVKKEIMFALSKGADVNKEQVSARSSIVLSLPIC